jgi:hypothetical protein
MSIGHPLGLMIMVLEIRALDPLLIIESQEKLNGVFPDSFKFFVWNFFPTPQPIERRQDALETPFGFIPFRSDLPHASLSTHKLEPLNLRIIQSFAHNLNLGASIRESKTWLNLL